MPMYQITSILRAGSAQHEISELLRKMSQIVLERDGVVAGINNWGLQQLAYRMRAHQEYHTHGRYVQFKIIASPATLKELERNMRLDKHVLRHMTIKEHNTSVAKFMYMDPADLAAQAHRVSKELFKEAEQPRPFGSTGRPGFGSSGGFSSSGAFGFGRQSTENSLPSQLEGDSGGQGRPQ